MKLEWSLRSHLALRSLVSPRALVSATLALALLATACSSSATEVSGTAEPTGSQQEARPSVAAIEPTAVSDPTPEAAGDDAQDAAEPTATPPTPERTELAADQFRDDNVQAISHDGAYAYAGTTSPWNEPTRCTAAARESLAVIDLSVSLPGDDLAPFGAGLDQTGDVRQVVLGPGRSVAVLSSCGPYEDATVWLDTGVLSQGGQFEASGDRITFDTGQARQPFLLRWSDENTVELQFVIETDPDDFESWLIERRHVDVRSGEVVEVEQFSYVDDVEYISGETLTTANGDTYRVIADPQENVGCEGVGVASTIELDTGSDRRPALTQPDLVFSGVDGLHTSPGGYIAWTSGCEGFVTAYVGKLLDDGSIADAHFLDTYAILGDENYTEFRAYRLTEDDDLVAVGVSYASDSDERTLAVLRYDLADDPNFVTTAEPAPAIDDEPLFGAIGDDGSWHVGESLAPDPACGGSTLYGRTSGGFVRAFPTGQEIDRIVDVDLSQITEYDFGQDQTYASRTVVLQTECPGQYEGRRVWFGLESSDVIYGFGISRADLVEVADVLAVRDQVNDDGFVDATFIEVELLDGSVTELELEAVPFGF